MSHPIFGGSQRGFLIVGEAPNRAMHVGEREEDDACDIPRLHQLSGLSRASFRDLFGRSNVLRAWPGNAPDGGDLFPRDIAAEGAKALRPLLFQFQRVVFLGRRVAACFLDVRKPLPWFEWHVLPKAVGEKWQPDVLVAVSPHPSGTSQFWNDSRNVSQARNFWEKVASEALHHHECWRCGSLGTLRMEGAGKRPCEVVREVLGTQREDDAWDYNVFRFGCRSDGFTVAAVIEDAEGSQWDVTVVDSQGRKHQFTGPIGVCIATYGKSGAEVRTLAQAFEWLARELPMAGKSWAQRIALAPTSPEEPFVEGEVIHDPAH